MTAVLHNGPRARARPPLALVLGAVLTASAVAMALV